MIDEVFVRVAQDAVVEAMNALTAEIYRHGGVPPPDFLLDVAARAAVTAVGELDRQLPLDGAQVRALIEAMLLTALSAMVSSSQIQQQAFGRILAGVLSERPAPGAPSKTAEEKHRPPWWKRLCLFLCLGAPFFPVM